MRRPFLIPGPILLGFTSLFKRSYQAKLPSLTKCPHCGSVKPMISKAPPTKALDFLGAARA